MIRYGTRGRQAIGKETRVLFVNRSGQEWLLTNDTKEDELCRIMAVDAQGRIGMEGILLGSLFAHDPYIIPELVRGKGTYAELNPAFFERDPVTDGLIGQAVGDAFGVPYEFLSRQQVRALNPRDMVGKDTGFDAPSRWGQEIPSGAWSDDTSMTVAAMQSMIRCGGEIDCEDVMNCFQAWWNEGKYTSLDFSFGLGTNISCALARHMRGTPASACGGKEWMDNGNGALMRMFPFAVYCSRRELDLEETLSVIRKAAGLTHAHEINAMSCLIYTLFLDECMRTLNPHSAYRNAVLSQEGFFRSVFAKETVQAHEAVFCLEASSFDPQGIAESGYVVDSLLTALWCILHTQNYEEAVTEAVRFGYDTDTNAAITGSVAGVLYGQSQIPERWLSALRKKEMLLQTAERFSLRLSMPPRKRKV